jgi:Spy/CpxP family protein refolding chaperone
MRFARTIAVLCAVGTPFLSNAYAQHQPYSGQQARDVKALSPDEVKQYLAGAGMGYAKAAELNHYPGPMHALELAEQLRLSAEQRASTESLMKTHKAEARDIGARLIEAERALDALFRSGNLSAETLSLAVSRSAALQGEYRLSHLETHRRMRALLTAEQVARYDALRGYSTAASHTGHKH